MERLSQTGGVHAGIGHTRVVSNVLRRVRQVLGPSPKLNRSILFTNIASSDKAAGSSAYTFCHEIITSRKSDSGSP